MKTFTFQLENNDRNHGTVYLPDNNENPLPVVVYCHGWGASQALNPSTQAVCTALLEHKAALVAFDFWGCGKTSGSYSEMSYGRWTTNLRDVFEWVAQQHWANRQKIGCFGISSGTTAALRYAIQNRDLAFVVSVATCLGSNIHMPNGPGKQMVENWDKLLGGGSVELFGVPFKLDFFKDFIGHAPVFNLRDITCPVFFLTGADDNPFRRSDAWLGYTLMKQKGLNVRYFEIEGGNHVLDNVPDICAQEAITWLKSIGVLVANG